MYQKAQWGLNKHGNHIELGSCSACQGCSPEFCCSFETHSFMRGWVGALRRYSEPSCSLQGEGKNNVGCRYHSPHQTTKEEKQVRKKQGNPHRSTELVLPGDVGMCLPQQGHSWEGCGYCPGWGTH